MGVQDIISKFVNDMKIGNIINNDGENLELQKGIDMSVGWADKWQVKLNAEKSEVVHCG